MAAGALKSDQETNRTASPVVMNDANTKGKVHRAYFSHTVPVGADVDANTTIDLVKVPKGARFVGGYWYNDAAFSGGATLVSIGDSGAVGRFAIGIAATAENFTQIPNTAATAGTSMGYVFPADTVIVAKCLDVAIVVGGKASGWIDYVLE